MRRSLLLLAVALLVGLLAPTSSSAERTVVVSHEVVRSRADGNPIAITTFHVEGVGRRPVVFDSHGWGGSRRSEVDDTVRALLDAGFGVVSIDQRGFGESGGQAHVQDPSLEAQDILAVVDHVATLPWVRLDGPGDPRMGAIGGSYGGGYQLMTALTETFETGRTRFDALAPEIAWHDLPESLAPSGVPRTLWNVVLYAAGARTVPTFIHEGFVEGMATNQIGAGLAAEFAEHSPRWFSDRRVRLDVPTLIGQGTTDNLFNLNQGWKNFERVLTPRARAQSRLVAYNGGHAIPNAAPPGIGASGDACSPGGFRSLSIAFFRNVLLGEGPAITSTLRYPYSLTSASGDRCIATRSLAYRQPVPLDDVTTTAGAAGAPMHVPVVTGPGAVAGVPALAGRVVSVALDARLFVGLSVGTSPADARVVQHNLLPLRVVDPAVDGVPFRLELPGVAVDLAEGETLFLTITPVADQFVGNGSRTPGLVQLTELVLGVPRPMP